ncbi:NAD-dependent epimerase/dehydratase family protein [Candidatus Nitrososphaera sp. FF02]|uniref:NAD-dependent epimerase/dehydratase family protein n=1 Tax=Candidatus Nitrososphaera sp. FF02 TaxID=3398226 RepID=UPI0039EA1781
MKITKVLVTGSEGLIGKELIARLSQRGFQVYPFDIKTRQDILDRNLVEEAVGEVDGVIHLAAVSRVITGFDMPYQTVSTNVMGTVNLLESIRTRNPSCWMILGSSREVYGEAKLSAKETDPIRPINVYGATKAAGEFLTLCYGSNYSLKTVVARFSNVYGGRNDHADRVIPRFFGQALSDKDITVFGGTQLFDFVHLNDTVKGITTLAEGIVNNYDLQDRRTFHFVTGNGTRLTDLAEKIISITKSKSTISFMAGRNYDVDTFVGDPSDTRKILNWQAEVSLDDGLKQYYNLLSSK